MNGLILGLLLSLSCSSQPPPPLTDHNNSNDHWINFHVNETVKNKEEDYFKAVVSQWEDYLVSFRRMTENHSNWHSERYPYPDFTYTQIIFELYQFRQSGREIHCNILGVKPIENDYYLLNSMFYNKDSIEQVNVNFIVTVYAKKVDDQYLLVNKTEYTSNTWKQHQIGNLNYFVHPKHQFVKKEAMKMEKLNKEIAKMFKLDPIPFDYMVANNTDEISKLVGFDFFSYSFQPTQSGGMADTYNQIIYAGNNSAFYPHEVIHLYTHAYAPKQHHQWVDEGVATLFGGSTGYSLDWHLQKLKRFLEKEPQYKFDDLDKLRIDIPNGEYKTDFMYVIGGLICKRIYEKEGMQGLFDALKSGRSEDDYFALIEKKLGVARADFGNYIKSEMKRLPLVKDQDLDQLIF